MSSCSLNLENNEGLPEPADPSKTSQLPRLAYVGDVPVESTYHGSALLYRLFQDYPPDRLLVVEAEPFRSLPGRRLPNVPYRGLSMGVKRWRNTRFSRWANSWLTVTSSNVVRRLRRSFQEFHPEAILTIAQGYSWLAAAQLANEAKLPLHLIVHDDWPTNNSVVSWLRPWQGREFGRVYRRAASRLCISPFMEEEYRRSYGVAGKVLYPSRAKDCPSFNRPPQTYLKETGSLVGAYAGNIFHAGYARLIVHLAECLERRGGRLLLFGPNSPESLRFHGLNRNNILPQGLVSSQELISRLRHEADFVFVPMTFDADGSQRNMRFAFPSKITDYTAAALPLLVCGPAYCSAVRWAQQHAPVAQVVTSQAIEEIDVALSRLENTHNRQHLGRTAFRVGNDLFSHQVCSEILRSALLIGRDSSSQDARIRERKLAV